MTAPETPIEQFPPTLREVMLRGRWLGMLALCLAVAGVFGWLGQWQLSRAITTDPPPPGITEQQQPLEAVVEPGQYLPEPYVGQQVEVRGTWVAEDFIPVVSRFNDGVEGYWLTGQLRVSEAPEKTSIAVALGWAATLEDAQAAAEEMAQAVASSPGETVVLSGRIISDEGVVLPPRDDVHQLSRMSPAALLSRWHDIDELSVYRPYLTSAEPWAGLTQISSPAPEELSPLNLLNLFYAAEWAVFAGFAFYLWYRLAKDAWEREVEELEDDADDDSTRDDEGRPSGVSAASAG